MAVEMTTEESQMEKRHMKEENVQQISQLCRQQGDQRGQGKQGGETQYEEQQIKEGRQSGDRQ